MRQVLVCLLLLCYQYSVFAQEFTICSWNLQNMGKSKSTKEIAIMAEQLLQCDLIALQEINTGADGKQKIASLVEQMNLHKRVFYYSVSSPTSSTNPHESECYAFIWNKEKVYQQKKFHLDAHFEQAIVREPYIGYFKVGMHSFTVANFHAVPKSKQPQQEIAKFKHFDQYYKGQHIIFVGDFNTAPEDQVFNPLKKKGYKYYPENQATTLKQQYHPSQQFANSYDHLWWPQDFGIVLEDSIIPFHQLFGTDMKAARHLSDHVPIKIKIAL